MESIDLLVLRTARDWLAAGERVLLATVAHLGFFTASDRFDDGFA